MTQPEIEGRAWRLTTNDDTATLRSRLLRIRQMGLRHIILVCRHNITQRVLAEVVKKRHVEPMLPQRWSTAKHLGNIDLTSSAFWYMAAGLFRPSKYITYTQNAYRYHTTRNVSYTILYYLHIFQRMLKIDPKKLYNVCPVWLFFKHVKSCVTFNKMVKSLSN